MVAHGRERHPCYCCGKPCTGKGCLECLRKNRGGKLSRVYLRRRHREGVNDVAFVDDGG